MEVNSTMISFNKKLKNSIEAKKSHLCIGLDISPEGLNDNSASLEDLKGHTKKIINATQDLAVAFKPNLGFFERWGVSGFQWLEDTIRLIDNDTIVIGDAKRGDIGNTAKQYAKSLFGYFNFDAVTLSPYMGYDSIEPFISDPTRGVFILCRTSNKSATDFKMLKITIENYLRLLLRLALVGTLMIILGSWLVQPHLKRFLALEKKLLVCLC